MIVATDTQGGHMRTLGHLFSQLQDHNLIAKLEKCQFGYSRLEFLGHVGNERIQTEPGKVLAMPLNSSKPTTKKKLCSFLDLIRY